VTGQTDPYKTLQVDPEAEDEVIAAAYRRLARKYHPDVAIDSSAATRMAAINAAWEIVGDPARRAAFDRERAVQIALGRRTAEAEAGRGAAAGGATARPPETVSRDWTSGRSTSGSGYEPSMRTADAAGAAGSLGEIARTDLEYIEWLDRMPIGRHYRDEIDAILRAAGRRRSAGSDDTQRRGLFRRR
jgi:curved DNA-binding protein CbpA